MADSLNRRLVRVPDPSPYWQPPAPRQARGALDRAVACPRQALAAAAQRKGESLASLSALIGHGHGYLQRFVRDGVPRALTARDHQILADFLGVQERDLGVRDLWRSAA